MDGSIISERLSDGRAGGERAPFLTTHRAVAACTRELDRLAEEVAARAATLHLTLGTEAPVVRRVPDRCIVQLGPVALTLVWLRSSLDTVASGELLVNVWHGSVAPRVRPGMERVGRAPAKSAEMVWEQVLTPEADTEAEWRWVPPTADAAPLASADLATVCIERLKTAYMEQPQAVI